MAVESESPFTIVRSLVKKFLGEMRVIRTTSEEQAKARAEEIKSISLAPGKQTRRPSFLNCRPHGHIR